MLLNFFIAKEEDKTFFLERKFFWLYGFCFLQCGCRSVVHPPKLMSLQNVSALVWSFFCQGNLRRTYPEGSICCRTSHCISVLLPSERHNWALSEALIHQHAMTNPDSWPWFRKCCHRNFLQWKFWLNILKYFVKRYAFFLVSLCFVFYYKSLFPLNCNRKMQIKWLFFKNHWNLFFNYLL